MKIAFGTYFRKSSTIDVGRGILKNKNSSGVLDDIMTELKKN